MAAEKFVHVSQGLLGGVRQSQIQKPGASENEGIAKTQYQQGYITSQDPNAGVKCRSKEATQCNASSIIYVYYTLSVNRLPRLPS